VFFEGVLVAKNVLSKCGLVGLSSPVTPISLLFVGNTFCRRRRRHLGVFFLSVCQAAAEAAAVAEKEKQEAEAAAAAVAAAEKEKLEAEALAAAVAAEKVSCLNHDI
jgi:hypothetical protein